MSDTPRTDDVVMQAVAQGMRLAPVAELARELERENAALREALHDIMTESDEQVIWRMARAALEQKEAQP
jgi:hypothetical protein